MTFLFFADLVVFPISFYFLHLLRISLFPFYLNSTFLLPCVLLSKVYLPLLVFFLRHPIFLKRIKSHTYQGFCSWKAILTVEVATSSLIQLSYLVDSFHLKIKLAQFHIHLTSETLQCRARPCWPSQFSCRDSKSSSKIISFIFSIRKCIFK